MVFEFFSHPQAAANGCHTLIPKGQSVRNVFRQAGLSVPADVSVIGYDGLDHANRQPPFLTTVAIPLRRLIEDALEIVAQSLGQPTPSRHIELTGEILPGQTVSDRIGGTA